MHRRRHFIYPDKPTLVAAFLCEVEKFISEAAPERPLYLALSGGSTPMDIFRHIREHTARDTWPNVHLYWGDERCVPPEDEESNYGNARAHLIEPLAIPGTHVHRIRGEEDPATEAVRYGNLLMDELPVENGFPVFDWIWLGLGEDGHTASIFPGQMDLWRAERPCVATTHPESGQKRISLTGGTINAARRITFLVTGENKSPVINQIVMKEGRYQEFPAYYVAPVKGELEWFLDKEATSWL